MYGNSIPEQRREISKWSSRGIAEITFEKIPEWIPYKISQQSSVFPLGILVEHSQKFFVDFYSEIASGIPANINPEIL